MKIIGVYNYNNMNSRKHNRLVPTMYLFL